MLMCAECGVAAGSHARGWRGGWRAYLAYDREADHFPYGVMYCPRCAEREFGPLPHAERRAS
jgi:ribosomal protein L34E